MERLLKINVIKENGTKTKQTHRFNKTFKSQKELQQFVNRFEESLQKKMLKLDATIIQKARLK